MARLILILYVFRSYDIFCFSRLFAMSQIKKKKKQKINNGKKWNGDILSLFLTD